MKYQHELVKQINGLFGKTLCRGSNLLSREFLFCVALQPCRNDVFLNTECDAPATLQNMKYKGLEYVGRRQSGVNVKRHVCVQQHVLSAALRRRYYFCYAVALCCCPKRQ